MARSWWEQYEAERAAEAKEKAKDARFGVYQHANWIDGGAVETGTGYVVREMTGAVPYARMQPVAIYKRRAAAQAKADKLNG